MNDGRITRVGGLLRELGELTEEKKRREKVDDWARALKAAEDRAKNAPNAKRRLYQVNYRVDHHDSDAKGSSGSRREALVEMLKSLSPVERHQSTSGWIVWLHIEKASDIAMLLAAPLDVKVDFLSVAELTANRTTFGDAKLKSK